MNTKMMPKCKRQRKMNDINCIKNIRYIGENKVE